MAEDLRGDLTAGDCFLTSPTTLRWLREETVLPGPVIDRKVRDSWAADGSTSAAARAAKRVQQILAQHQPTPLSDDVRRELLDIISADAKRHGLDRLPGV